MYTPDARQQWVGWHSRIVGERGWTGTYWEGDMDVFLRGRHGRIKGVKDVLRREVWCIVRGGQGRIFLDGGTGAYLGGGGGS